MSKIIIRETHNPTIIKFELSHFITKTNNFEFKNIDEAGNSPLAQQLFHLPFIKTVYISGNFIAIERYNIVSWDDVKDAVAEQIETFIANGGIIIKEENKTSNPIAITVYAESTPNPAVLKFVANKLLTTTAVECKNRDQTQASPLAKALFSFPFIKEIFIDENYISITKYDSTEWQEITLELRTFIKSYLEKGQPAINETFLKIISQQEKEQDILVEQRDEMSQKIITILDEYVKPAVASDGGNIVFDSYNKENKIVKVILQGACSGCPSSIFTLKNGIETMLKNMLNDEAIQVEALNL